ncbi:MAG TPA: membrane dipeptidase [Vicinamibacterales bacterium]|nr:membrane dipeptidase [Vicinamibacterales bacterium]
MTRREALRAVAIGAAAPAVLRGRFTLFAQSSTPYSARAVRLVESTVVVDLLNQFQFPDYAVKPPKIEQWLTMPGTFTADDAARYRASGITVFCLGDGARDYAGGVEFFARWNGFLAQYPDWLTRIDKASDFERAKSQNKIGVMLTFQDSTHFRTPDDVTTFFGLGQRVSQLTYNFNNRIGSGFLENRDGGLSVFGHSIMQRMEQVGMAVDVSHCGDQTTLDALDAATKPVLFTHATARALVPGHLRCKTDEAIQKMAKSGGAMGIAMIRFMVRNQEPVTIEHVLDHVDYVAKLVGVEHVAIGSDLDVVGNPNAVNGGGFDPRTQPNFARYQYHADPDGGITIRGLNHVKRVYDLTEGLIRRGYTDAQIGQILGGNARRVLSSIWPR